MCGVETRQQLTDKIQKYNSDHQLQTAYDLLVTAEQMHALFVDEVRYNIKYYIFYCLFYFSR